MIFVDTNVFIYAVGKPHPLRTEAQNFFIASARSGKRLLTSAEVLQELLHVYLPVGRMNTLDAALKLATNGVHEILPITFEDVVFARTLADRHRQLTARDLLHLAVCQRNGIKQIKTFDRALEAAFQPH